jgi:hypothetical protein
MKEATGLPRASWSAYSRVSLFSRIFYLDKTFHVVIACLSQVFCLRVLPLFIQMMFTMSIEFDINVAKSH